MLGNVAALDRKGCDLCRPDELRAIVRRLRPAVIVNAAAYTAVDAAEADVPGAFLVNAEAPAVLAEEAAASGSLLVHYSTEHVFDGDSPRPYTEFDACSPRSAYGKSKLAGEQAIVASGAAYLIFRTSWVFGVHGDNFLKTILRQSMLNHRLRVVADQFGAPTPASLVADVTAHAVRDFLLETHAISMAPRRGIHHLAAAGTTTWNGYAREIVRVATALGAGVRTAADNIEEVASSAYPMAAPRPANARLDCTRIEQSLAMRMPSWQDGVRRVIEQLILDKP
ncbi:dTDP-4-dehydrorhamnose reductase subunit, NAD(P)-binding, of dTDP-L-rhamnose synthase [Cupriavidus taiwanensis]|nr:dTDP-4-dehydrorhamnose reductase subunit, NAD(P)-binding, of dTDP-L-rhamnose synthase [Cupriavidus taiwanensis]SOZ25280.1 dTDP-4-dehydrorhamnose reductase subunit, NAD(P)-binding, of dTDP-L-rhamnose synthase [Cupriavidus taiwanensis]SOZ44531.1 dTDP-4-dehydrorhamnose reductase subunit, NAD(P)-binding, of dTDP-L-rhamnose synthase [Cupriavidus taiwanensis]